MWLIVVVIPFVLGLVAGIQAPWYVQLILAVAGVVFLMTPYVREMELGSLIPMGMVGFFIVGMVIGDIYVFIFFPELRPDWVIPNPLIPPGAERH